MKLYRQLFLAHGAYLSSISVAELKYGVYASQQVERNRESLLAFLVPFEILPFDHRAAGHFVRLRDYLRSRGQPIGPYDMLIVAQTLAHGLILEDWK